MDNILQWVGLGGDADVEDVGDPEEDLHLSPNVSTSVRIFGSAEVRHTTKGTLSGF